ncbi:MAG: hypothetical protein GXP29_06850 [Planctomycetes bacterium]|nr:hypothetical protein [Planctomycetota bacterium]
MSFIPNRRKFLTSRHVALSVVLAASLFGCNRNDRRIDLDEFMQMREEFVQSEQEQRPKARPATLSSGLDRETVGPGDVIELSFPGAGLDPIFAAMMVRVDRRGNIDLPLVGDVHVGGMELEDVEDAVAAAYVPEVVKDASVHAILKKAAPTSVLVHGAVTKPGLTKLRRTERNLLHAIHRAGGLSEISAATVTLSRLGSPGEDVTVNLSTPEGLSQALALAPLEDGDIVTVQSAKVNAIFIGGLVNAPRTQIYPPGVKINSLQALAAAGGLRTDVFPKEATLVRRMPNGEDVHVRINLARLANGDDPNLMLAAGDILWVPETAATRVQDWINKNIFIRAGLNASMSYNVSGSEFLNRRGSQGIGGGGGGLQDQFDPFGFLNRGAGINAIQTQGGG